MNISIYEARVRIDGDGADGKPVHASLRYFVLAEDGERARSKLQETIAPLLQHIQGHKTWDFPIKLSDVIPVGDSRKAAV